MSYHGLKSIVRYDGSTQDSWRTYTCGFCNSKVSGAVVARVNTNLTSWLWCTSCGNPSVIALDGIVYPGSSFGPVLEGLPSEVEASYNEARQCYSVNAFTACELICRKILMHVGVDKGAKEGETFASYLDYLETSGYITPPMKKWVDLIRKHGNASTHKLESPDVNRTQGTLMFTAELLRIIYEMDHVASKYAP